MTLPIQAQRALIKAKLKAGCILHLFCNFIADPHNKFMVVAHIDYDEKFMLVMLINSEIHPLIDRDPVLRTCQVPIPQSVYTFLDHDSYLNCASVFDDLDIEEVIDALLRVKNTDKGALCEEEILKVIEAVNAAPTIPDYDKNLIIASLGD